MLKKKFTNYRELYFHFTKSFYLGEYSKGDRFPTQIELVATYGVAANSIKKVFKLLLEDGFISTDRSFGTYVTFDIENPAHRASVPLFSPDPQDSSRDTLEIPSCLIAYTTCHSLQLATQEQLDAYLASAEEGLQDLRQHPQLTLLDSPITVTIDRGLHNQYINDFSELMLYNYLFVNQRLLLDTTIATRINAVSQTYYAGLCALLRERKDFQPLVPLYCSYYKELHSIPGLLVFGKLAQKNKMFAQQALYTQLVHKLLLYIMAEDIRKGDLLPPETELAQRYGVSLITVRKAAGVLKEIGLIDGQRFVGTRMQEDWDSPAVQAWMNQLLEAQHQTVADALFAEYVLARAVYGHMAQNVPALVVDEMERKLEMQWQAHKQYSAPLFMSEVLLAPLVDYIANPLLTICFYHIHDDLTKFLGIRLLQMSHGFGGTTQVYTHATQCIMALRQGNLQAFFGEADIATLRNWELLRSALDKTIYSRMGGTEK